MERINGILFKQMLESGMNNLSNHSAEIDALNVFPVPDGDTGTNMHLTVSNGVKEALKTNSDSVKDIAKTLSRGLLMGARGNSGVITSQIFRGIYQAVEDLDDMDASQLAHALVNGSRVAYRAVMRPVEGTILTVVREAADYTYAYTTTEDVTDCMDVMKKMVEEANASLQRTPELLPVLAEVGVVDSGGKGLCVILEGFLAAMEGHPVQLEGAKAAGESAQAKVEGGEEEYGFCTEFILKLSENGVRHFSETSFKDELATIGNSIVCVQDEDLVKVHVHTLEPFTAIKMGRRQGRFIKLKVENMQEQHDNIIEKEEEEKLPFTDVEQGDWFYDAVKGAWENGLINGVTATTYQPKGTLTVAEAIKLASALHQMIKDGKVTLLAVCGKEAVASGIKAGDIIRNIAPIVGGKGGGKPDSAMGGGTNALKLDDALAAVDDFVAEHLK